MPAVPKKMSSKEWELTERGPSKGERESPVSRLRSLAPYLRRVRDGSRYSKSTLHETRLEYADDEADGVEVSVFRGPAGPASAV